MSLVSGTCLYGAFLCICFTCIPLNLLPSVLLYPFQQEGYSENEEDVAHECDAVEIVGNPTSSLHFYSTAQHRRTQAETMDELFLLFEKTYSWL